MAGVFFKKYSQGNYFEGLDFVDKIKIENIPLDAFPVFHSDTEEVGEILQYNPGEFIVSLSINTGEISSGGKSIERFFRETNNNKFLVIVFFGTLSVTMLNPRYYAGSFDNSNITYFYTSQTIDIRIKPIEKEIEAAMRNYFVGILDTDRTLDSFLTNILLPSTLTDYLSVTKSFSSYRTLIGDNSILVNANVFNSLRNSAGNRPFVLDIFDQFQQLMWGTGLLYKARLLSYFDPEYDFPKFSIYVFNLDSISTATEPIIFGNPEDTTIFNKKHNLMITYRNFPVNIDLGGNVTLENIKDGVGWFGSEHAIKNADYVNRNIPHATSQLPAFWQRTNDQGLIHLPSPGGLFDIRAFYDDATNFIDLPLHNTSFVGVFGTDAQIAFSRVLNTGGDFGTSYSVYNYTITQYKRYITSENKKCKILECLWDENHIYNVYEKITLPEEGTTRDYYINRIEDIKFQSNGNPPSCKLTIVEL